MDEAVWAAFGIVCAIIGLGIIASTFWRGSNALSGEQLDAVSAVFANSCAQVCGLAENSAVSVRIDLAKEAVISVLDDRVCVTGGNGNTSCGRCPCQHAEDTVVLNLTDAGAFFASHTYSCRYERIDTNNTDRLIRMNCSG